MKAALCAALILASILLLALSSSAPARGSQETGWLRPAGALPSVAPRIAQPSQASAVYDEQLGMTFAQDFAELDYNVTAVAQTDAQGFGPGYLLNGLTDAGYWYQVGIAFDWPYQSGGYVPGFHFLYEAFNDSGKSVFPAGGGGGLSNFTGPVNNGDAVLLQLTFSGGQMTFIAKDWNTGSAATESFPASGSRFIGLESPSGPNGFFTGLMTEWYHANPFYSDEGETDYTNPSSQLTSATLWAEEFDANTSASLFGSSQSYTFTDPYQLKVFSLEGATEYGDAYEFITGAMGRALLTLSYAVSGTGSGYLAPVLKYTWDGTQETADLTETPTSFIADKGSYWQVSAALPGGSRTERWMTDEQANGTAAGDLSEALTYFHQFLMGFEYRADGGGTGYGPPQVTAVEFGSAATVGGNTSAWVDAGTSFSYPVLLQGSNSTTRWASQGYTATATGPADVSVTYFRQVSLTIQYLIMGGGKPTGPTLNGSRFGEAVSAVVTNDTGYFLDAGAQWSMGASLQGGGPQERWVATQDTNGTLTEPTSLTVSYIHQYHIITNADPEAGGSSAGVPAVWADPGSDLQISATPSQGWEFGGWVGSGSGSYDGASNPASVVVTGPIVENATFYPGLTITAGADGSVTYSWQGGSGSVGAGETSAVYVPPGTDVRLESVPSTFYVFEGWEPGNVGSGPAISLRVDAPLSVSSSVSIDSRILIGGAIALTLIATLAVIAARRGRRASPDFNSSGPAPQI